MIILGIVIPVLIYISVVAIFDAQYNLFNPYSISILLFIAIASASFDITSPVINKRTYIYSSDLSQYGLNVVSDSNTIHSKIYKILKEETIPTRVLCIFNQSKKYYLVTP